MFMVLNYKKTNVYISRRKKLVLHLKLARKNLGSSTLLIFSVSAKFASFQIRINITSADWKMESLIVIKKSLV